MHSVCSLTSSTLMLNYCTFLSFVLLFYRYFIQTSFFLVINRLGIVLFVYQGPLYSPLALFLYCLLLLLSDSVPYFHHVRVLHNAPQVSFAFIVLFSPFISTLSIFTSFHRCSPQILFRIPPIVDKLIAFSFVDQLIPFYVDIYPYSNAIQDYCTD